MMLSLMCVQEILVYGVFPQGQNAQVSKVLECAVC